MNDAMHAERCQLVLVDYQQRLMPAIHQGEAVVAEALRLADAARALGVPVTGTEQNPAGLGPNVASLRQRCASTLAKMHFDACADGLLGHLDEQGRKGPDGGRDAERGVVVIAGCEAHVCLLQTALGLMRAGWRLFVVPAACGSRTPSDQALAMQRLAAAGATLVSVEMVIFEWLADCRHPRFKELLGIVKRTPATGS